MSQLPAALFHTALLSLLIVQTYFSEAEVRALAKERQKKDNHNLSEF